MAHFCALMAQLIWCNRRYLSGNDNKARRVCTCVCDSDYLYIKKTLLLNRLRSVTKEGG